MSGELGRNLRRTEAGRRKKQLDKTASPKPPFLPHLPSKDLPLHHGPARRRAPPYQATPAEEGGREVGRLGEREE